ncbi:hypothetical protein [Bradyrhizobium amphicarpaeae]|uniref:Uncharacterized protein n=1 Tax=Bradyrhizobium amphicarpaeae TaxID=1404768 RepID=A0A2U8PMH7_9BRAD|nr:hypothetical protein [Bradyrhizobium amphicarpaeae]AWL98840.1 hypothetical protein CIT40_01570 [Bradyrhizobium amphicarpaeae]
MPLETLLKSLLTGPFSFEARPEPVAGDLRMSWGIAILLLSLFYSRGKKGSFQRIQFLAHAVRLPEGRQDVRELFEGRLRPADLSVRVEPWLNRAVTFGHALKLLSVDKGQSVSLTPRGAEIANIIANTPDVLTDERTFLSQIAPRLTENTLTKIWRMEDLL